MTSDDGSSGGKGTASARSPLELRRAIRDPGAVFRTPEELAADPHLIETLEHAAGSGL